MSPTNAEQPHDSAEEQAALLTAYALGQLSAEDAKAFEESPDFSASEVDAVRRLGKAIQQAEPPAERRSSALKAAIEVKLLPTVQRPEATGTAWGKVIVAALSLSLLIGVSVVGFRATSDPQPVAKFDIQHQGGPIVKTEYSRDQLWRDLYGRENRSQTAGKAPQFNHGLSAEEREGLMLDDKALEQVLAEALALETELYRHDLLRADTEKVSEQFRTESLRRATVEEQQIRAIVIRNEGRRAAKLLAAEEINGVPRVAFGLDALGPPTLDFDVQSELFLEEQVLVLREQVLSGESYAPLIENRFTPAVGGDAVSTFSIDVDTASYTNVRRMLRDGQLPPADAVRIEEMLNYFQYDYPAPTETPVAVDLDLAVCPWETDHLLLRVAMKGKEIPQAKRPPCNLVFLLDVSGSMGNADKLPLLQESMKILTAQLTKDDHVTIVTYAGDAGLRLAPTRGDQQIEIRTAIDALSSGGSTNGEAGILLAYKHAQANFNKEGVNRVILATDGDLNVGLTDEEELVQLIQKKAAGGVFLTVLGFGTGNLQDSRMEKLADHGNGVYAYIDSVKEGRRVLADQAASTLVTIAKDVKLQLEFNPRRVGMYRLIGYSNRMLATEDFADDKKDAGDIGAGHTVTAFYELMPPHKADEPPGPETPLGEADWKYQQRSQTPGLRIEWSPVAMGPEWVRAAVRYKSPQGAVSKKLEFVCKDEPVPFNQAEADFQFAVAVASFGMQLRHSIYKGDAQWSTVQEIAAAALGKDPQGDRAEFLTLVKLATELAKQQK